MGNPFAHGLDVNKIASIPTLNGNVSLAPTCTTYQSTPTIMKPKHKFKTVPKNCNRNLKDRRPVSPPELIHNIPVRITTRPRRNVDNSMKINNTCLSRIPLVGLTPTYHCGSPAKVPRIFVSNVRSAKN